MSDDYIQEALFGVSPAQQKTRPRSIFPQPVDPYRTHKIVLGVFLIFYLLFVFFNNPKPLSEILKENFLLLMVILVSLTVHECAHAWVNDQMGDSTAKQEGRISLNPMVHLDWFGLLLFFLGGLGWAKPVPVVPSHFKNVDRSMILSASAGPISNFLLAFLGAGLLKLQILFLKDFYLEHPVIGEWAFSFTLLFIGLNMGVGFFNFIPLPPLDGSLALKYALPENKRQFMTDLEVFGSMILMLVVSTNIPRNLLAPLVNRSMDLIFIIFMIKV